MKSNSLATSLAELPAESLSFMAFRPGQAPTLPKSIPTRPSDPHQADPQLSVYALATSSFEEEETWPHGGLNE